VVDDSHTSLNFNGFLPERRSSLLSTGLVQIKATDREHIRWTSPRSGTKLWMDCYYYYYAINETDRNLKMGAPGRLVPGQPRKGDRPNHWCASKQVTSPSIIIIIIIHVPDNRPLLSSIVVVCHMTTDNSHHGQFFNPAVASSNSGEGINIDVDVVELRRTCRRMTSTTDPPGQISPPPRLHTGRLFVR
jgi:hypothetical protein